MATAVTTEEEQAPTSLPFRKSCKECSHLPVCSLYRAIAPLMENFKEKPFEAEQLAIICKELLLKSFTEIANNTP